MPFVNDQSQPIRGKSTSPQHHYQQAGLTTFQLNAYPNQNHLSSSASARSVFLQQQQQQQQLLNSSLSQSQYNSIGVSEHEQVGFFGLLDALYEANRNILQH
jgi:hypothetical protein